MTWESLPFYSAAATPRNPSDPLSTGAQSFRSYGSNFEHDYCPNFPGQAIHFLLSFMAVRSRDWVGSTYCMHSSRTMADLEFRSERARDDIEFLKGLKPQENDLIPSVGRLRRFPPNLRYDPTRSTCQSPPVVVERPGALFFWHSERNEA